MACVDVDEPKEIVFKKKFSIPRSVYLEALKNAPPPRSLARYKGQNIRLDISDTMSQIRRQKTSPQSSRSASNFFSFKASLLNKMYEDKKKRWADEDARKLKYSQEIYDEEELVDLEEDLEISDTSDEETAEPEQDDFNDLDDLDDADQTEEKDVDEMVVNKKRRPKIDDDDADEAPVDFEDLPTEGEESDSEEKDSPAEAKNSSAEEKDSPAEEKDSPVIQLTPVAVVVEKIEIPGKIETHTISDQEEGYDGEIEDDLDNESDDDDAPIDDEAEVENDEENEDEDKENRDDNEEENVKTTDFIFNEADVSGTDSSDDEDPDDDIDELIDDEGAEKVDSEKARKEIQKIYHKELLNEDKRMLLQLQERYLEDGDLHSDQRRVKKFRWGTANPVWLDNARYSDSSTDMSDDNDDDDDDRPVFKLNNISLPSTSTENKIQESTQKPQPILATSNVQPFNKPTGLITSYLVRDKQLNNILSTKRRNPFNKDRMEFKRIKSGPQKCKTLFELYSRN